MGSFPALSPEDALGGQMEQWLRLQPDRRAAINKATMRILEVVVGRLPERIERDGS